ncbi:MAG: superinfection immunity protein [Deltaproteobacteria bacterium]|jgi:hypothetical protein|nr:superinfection immunity protein [Deltaproteobacteria bacterium]
MGSVFVALASLVVGVIALIVYIIPSVVAFKRRHRNRVPILLVNILGGWSLIAWIVALVWSLTDNTE